jgi:glutamate--cysteine ligase
MMRNTTSIQINLDFSSLESAERMAYIADCLQPFTALLFAHSPFARGRTVGNTNFRYIIWDNTDNSRCRNLLDHGIVGSENLLNKYIDYFLSIPTIFIVDEKGNYQKHSGTFNEWFNELETNNRLSEEQIRLGLHQIFTNVRFKDMLEIRGSDRPPVGFEMAPATFWVGLLFSDRAQEEIYETVNNWSRAERKHLNELAKKLDLSQKGPRGKRLVFWLEKIIDIAYSGLDDRSNRLGITNERKYLTPFIDMIFQDSLAAVNIQRKFNESGLSLEKFLIKQLKKQ